MDSINVLQYIIWADARGVIDKEDVIHVSGVKGQDPGIHEVFDGGFLEMLQEYLSHGA